TDEDGLSGLVGSTEHRPDAIDAGAEPGLLHTGDEPMPCLHVRWRQGRTHDSDPGRADLPKLLEVLQQALGIYADHHQTHLSQRRRKRESRANAQWNWGTLVRLRRRRVHRRP